MVLIAMLDKSGGMSFNNRRQSSDREVSKKILFLTAGRKLWIDTYSLPLFEGLSAPQIQIAADYLEQSKAGDYCLIERLQNDQQERLLLYSLEKVVVFKWNRDYPSDCLFPLALERPLWKLESSEDFPGTSHEKITMEVYTK